MILIDVILLTKDKDIKRRRICIMITILRRCLFIPL